MSLSRAPSPSPAPTLVDTRTPSLASVSDKHANRASSTSSGSPSFPTKPLPPMAGASTATFDAEKGELAEAYAGAGTAADPFQVKFNEGDPTNPFNFSETKRWAIVAVAALATLCVSFGSSVYAGGVAPMEVYFHKSSEVLILGLTVYVLGFAIGPLLWAPLSELYGRRIIFIATYAPFVVFQVGCALATNIETLIICRWFAGFFGSSPITNAGAVISDTFPASTRALALSLYALAPFAGPVLGPIVGGFVGQSISWRWIFWIELIFAGVMYVVQLITVPETYGPFLLRQRAERLSKETGLVYVSILEVNAPKETAARKLAVNVSRPFVLLARELIVTLMAVYAAVVYGILYALIAAVPVTFEEQRGWSSGVGGLAFIGIGLGMVSGVVINVFDNKKYARNLANNEGKPLAPEARLPIMMLAAILLPIGMFWFAWTSQPSVHWIVCIIGSVPFGCGMVLCFLSMMSYLVDAYLMYAASALAANSVLRSIFGAVFPLFCSPMMHNLGTSWALTIFAFLTLACAPIPFLFYRYGARIRARSTFAPGHAAPALSKVPTKNEADLAEEVAEADLALALREEEERAKAGRV